MVALKLPTACIVGAPRGWARYRGCELWLLRDDARGGIGLALTRLLPDVDRLELCELRGFNVLGKQMVIMAANLARQEGVKKLRLHAEQEAVGRKFLGLGFIPVPIAESGPGWYELDLATENVARVIKALE